MVDWELHLGDFPKLLHDTLGTTALPAPHAILFDAFSPAKNPAMWTAPIFADLFRCLDPARPCAMPTYSRSTMLRVTLLLAGFHVGIGHATGEKEETTIAANQLSLLEEPLPRSWLSRARRSKSAEPMWEANYRQAPLAASTWEALQCHPQFQ
jgi:tRNA U34 5-methylaminomethyl-2-thiouridine-forming methyltransferase MnmC